MSNFLDPKYWPDPPSYLPDGNERLESFEDWAAEGLKPEDIKDDEYREKYEAWVTGK
ncbi:MAG: hypothetical protein J0H09_23440 [Burkholderiales bacterium]|nr:hypothetical protein [Burkholderiales bacterium]